MKKLLAAALALVMLCGTFPALAREVVTFGDKVSVFTDTTYVDLGETVVRDYNAFYAFLDQLPNVKKVDMFATRIRPRQIDALVERYPGIEFGWTMQIAEHVIRTDWTAFSTLHYSGASVHGTKDLSYVRYCKNLRALDLGHNAVDNLDFLYELPELRVLIMACNKLTDITPIASLEHLEYLELFSNHITDVTPLAGLTHLMDLNLSFNDIEDLTPLCALTGLKRLWLYNSRERFKRKPVPEDQLAALQEALPDCEFNTTSNPTEGGWRVHHHFDTLHEFFRTNIYVPFQDSFPDEPEATASDLSTGSDLP